MIKERIQHILKHLSEGVYEKEPIIRLALLAAVSGESIFLLGPPGVAKSLIARRLKYAFKEGKSFEYLMSRFSTPDEIFGPVSIKKLKEEDQYERLTEKYLPDANIVFLDEIWKASPAIQNALLTILNEKIYRNGQQDISVDIHCIISASNELPAMGEGLEALWDRFLIRCEVQEVKSPSNFLNMITSTKNLYEDALTDTQKISGEEFAQWNRQIDQVNVPEEVLNTLQLIKVKLEEYNQRQPEQEKIWVYDRRWKKIVRLLRTSAFLNERTEVDLMDCFLLVHCLWNYPSQTPSIFEIISSTIRQYGYTIALNLGPLRKEISEFEQEVSAEIQIPHRVIVEELQSIDTEYLEVLSIRNYFEGSLIKKSDFYKLSLEQVKSISLYDGQKSLVNKINARLSHQAHTIEILYNAQAIPLRLKTVQQEKEEIITKKPHPVLMKFWQERAMHLQRYINEQKQKLKEQTPSALEHLTSHLFVEAHLSEIVENNIQQSIKTLNMLGLQIEKIMHTYESVPSN